MGLQKEKEEEQLLSSVYVGVHINQVDMRWSIVKERLRTLRAPYMRDKLKQDKEWRWAEIRDFQKAAKKLNKLQC